MSTKGSHPRANIDTEKSRKNYDAINFSGKAYGREVPKDELPSGIRSRIIYGKKR